MHLLHYKIIQTPFLLIITTILLNFITLFSYMTNISIFSPSSEYGVNQNKLSVPEGKKVVPFADVFNMAYTINHNLQTLANL